MALEEKQKLQEQEKINKPSEVEKVLIEEKQIEPGMLFMQQEYKKYISKNIATQQNSNQSVALSKEKLKDSSNESCSKT